jgi:hypothetical protein
MSHILFFFLSFFFLLLVITVFEFCNGIGSLLSLVLVFFFFKKKFRAEMELAMAP